MSATEQGIQSAIRNPQSAFQVRMPLIKWSVVRELTGLRRDEIFDRVDGSSLLHRGFAWVWNFSTSFPAGPRDLRFWRWEVTAESHPDTYQHGQFGKWELAWVINKILPPQRMTFHSGDVQMLFDLNRKTFMELRDELNGNMSGARNVMFARTSLVRFLERRWLGAVYDRKAESGKRKAEITLQPADGHERDNGRGTSGEAAQVVNQSPQKALSRSLDKVPSPAVSKSARKNKTRPADGLASDRTAEPAAVKLTMPASLSGMASLKIKL